MRIALEGPWGYWLISRKLSELNCYGSGREWGAVSPKTGAAERRLGSRKPPVGRMFRLIPVIDQTHLSFQRGQEAWLAEFEKWWGRNNEAALVARPTLRVQSNAEIPRAHGQRIMCDL